MKLVIVIPALNEEASLSALLDRIPAHIEGVEEIEVIVVDDGSVDDTRAVALAKGARVISHPMNKGLGRAFATGIDAALRWGADLIVNIDGDGQHPPEHIEDLIAPILAGQAEFVTGTRFAEPWFVPRMPRLKRLGNAVMARITNLVTGLSLSDVACGFRAYSRDTALKLNLFGRFTYTQESVVDLAHKGVAIEEVSVPVRGVREHGQSRVANDLRVYAARTLAILVRAVRDRMPLLFFGAIGGLLTVGGAACEATVGVNWILTGGTSPYQSLVVVGAIFLILGAMSFLSALLADMMGTMRATQENILYYEKRRYYESLTQERPQELAPGRTPESPHVRAGRQNTEQEGSS